jgi:hypothetical protein
MLENVCAVHEAVIARGEVVALAHVVVAGRLFDGHLRLLKLLPHL